MPRPLLTVSQSDSFIQIVDINSYTEWQTVQIQISWLLKKPTDLDLHWLQRQGISGLSRTRVNCCLYLHLQNGKSVLQLAFDKGTENIIRVITGIGASMVSLLGLCHKTFLIDKKM